MKRHVLPGFSLTMGLTLLYLVLIVLLPLSALILKAASLEAADYWRIVSSQRAVATYRVTLTAAAWATLFNAVFGLTLAWVLVRYSFPGKRLLDAVVDLPFALPTAVAGVALTALFAQTGWYGRLLAPLGISVAYTPVGIAVAMAFTSAPFVVRTIQPVLEDLRPEVEEAAQSLGASDLQVFARVIFPLIFPAFLAGCALAFARSLGEFGAIVFIAGNLPFRTEITALLAYIRLDEFDYPAAAAVASVMLGAAFVMLLVTNSIQFWVQRHSERA
ncbi:sulfate ABC transporter permease subunit CysT [Azospirillum halopraeferens]|uniref:sulfate ABC transporter permease subunit CysT n=1 Tax=Azospirillum halopraeferens TaxID=34010 RepID=UPI0004234FDD|nr:sulfate ABC transporter permease subunit CysT [Azospirillum halopraeferens]